MIFVWTGAALLEALHLRDVEGLTATPIADRLNAMFGARLTRSAVTGRLWHVDRAAAGHGAAGDGTMAPGWWRHGVSRQEEAA